MATLKVSQSIQMQSLRGTLRSTPPWCRTLGAVSMAVVPPTALGYRRAVPTKDNLLVWDYQGTLFMLRHAYGPASRTGTFGWRRAARSSIVCQNAKDFAVDPRSDYFRQYVYVLVSRQAPPPGWTGPPGSAPANQRCDCVEVYQQDNSSRVFRMTFHPSLTFSKLRLTGSETNRSLLLLTDTGKVYNLSVNETQLNTPRSYTVQLALKKVSTTLGNTAVSQIHTSYSSSLYVTGLSGEGTVFLEVHTAGVYRQLFGTLDGFDPHDLNTTVPLPLPYKVVRCSLSQNHLCLLDDCGRVFMQGSNRYGQLGTGDKIDRGQPTQVTLPTTPIEVWCGLNHSLALLEPQGPSGRKEVHGCGCGAGGRLPGWSKGSAVFVKLNIRNIPMAARSICATKDCLFTVSCHDIDEPPQFRRPPPDPKVEDEDEESDTEKWTKLQGELKRMKDCRSAMQQMDLLREAVRDMRLSSAQRSFLGEALNTIHQGLAIGLDH
ncbi:F-box only protein 24-like [Aplochiton taeniatus]